MPKRYASPMSSGPNERIRSKGSAMLIALVLVYGTLPLGCAQKPKTLADCRKLQNAEDEIVPDGSSADKRHRRSFRSISCVMRLHAGSYKALYDDVLFSEGFQGSHSAGKISIKFTILASGEVVDARIVYSDFSHQPGFEEKMLALTETIRFPELAPDYGAVTAEFPFVFNP
ncbi:MAG: hypothetical protein KDH09_00535 [Chrysiogenetes bacterium]|nr:hypothetical protein [Chrysiogenetes bacterium]